MKEFLMMMQCCLFACATPAEKKPSPSLKTDAPVVAEKKEGNNPSNETTDVEKKEESKPVVPLVSLEEKFQQRSSERETMVNNQILSRGVQNPMVLQAMYKVPRHLFMPVDRRNLAYEDHPVSIGLKQTISQPYIVAFMTEALEAKETDKVLEIGTGSGYQAAVLGEIVESVYTIEIIPKLSETAQEAITDLGYENIHFRIGDGYVGWAEEAPFDAIILTAAPPKIPDPLLEQLKTGGVLVAPVGKQRQELVKVRRTKDGFQQESILGVRFVPMTGQAQEESETDR